MGGPIRRNKTFFFVNYEGFRSVKASTNTAILITPAQAGGDFTGFPQLFDPYSTAADPARPGQNIRTPYTNNFIGLCRPVRLCHLFEWPPGDAFSLLVGRGHIP